MAQAKTHCSQKHAVLNAQAALQKVAYARNHHQQEQQACEAYMQQATMIERKQMVPVACSQVEEHSHQNIAGLQNIAWHHKAEVDKVAHIPTGVQAAAWHNAHDLCPCHCSAALAGPKNGSTAIIRPHWNHVRTPFWITAMASCKHVSLGRFPLILSQHNKL